MASLALGIAGNIIAPGVGGFIGAAIGSYIDSAVIAALTPPLRQEGPRLENTTFTSSTEGSPVFRIWGRMRTSGQVIWATEFEEEVVTRTEGGSGKGMSPKVEITEYFYYANFAIALCEGPITGVGRIWVDGAELEQTEITFRVYLGGETQEPDTLIEAKEGKAPAYRGIAYIVFERLPLQDYGNRIPQMQVEVYSLPPNAIERNVQGMTVMVSTEFGADPILFRWTEETDVGLVGGALQKAFGPGIGIGSIFGNSGLGSIFGGNFSLGGFIEDQFYDDEAGNPDNKHTSTDDTDWVASINLLEKVAPSLDSVMLYIPWYGDDLRAVECTIRPKVENYEKFTTPERWQVSGLAREEALVVSAVGEAPVFGGTPNDLSIIRAIEDLKDRGFHVTLCPIIIMDIPEGNTNPSPYGGSSQPVFPKPNKITINPAIDQPGSVDKTAAAGSQINSFLGGALPSHFSINNTVEFRGRPAPRVAFSGGSDWKYRRFILHYAQIAKMAGGVESFIIGSGLTGLTRARSSATAFPFVTGLISLADDVRSMLGAATKISYAADWTEYNNYRPNDGSNDVLFNLDPLWSSANIDFVGINWFAPLADWRDGTSHLDFDPSNEVISPYVQPYLQGNVEGGEFYDWFYADQAARDAQVRTTIDDPHADDDDWMFRQKDVRRWWLNLHNDRPGGVKSGSTTGWVAQSKEIRFVTYGAASVDKTANQPDVYPDVHSDDLDYGYPYYSNKARDDAGQRSVIEALQQYWLTNNPVSSVYGDDMINFQRSHLILWDVRPWPTYPQDAGWQDTHLWHNGPYLSGRFGQATAGDVIKSVCDEWDFTDYTLEPIPGIVDGVMAQGVLSGRSIIESISMVFFFDAVESEGLIKFQARLNRLPVMTVDFEDLVVQSGEAKDLYSEKRGQETELPAAVKIKFGDNNRDDQAAEVEAQRAVVASKRVVEYSPPIVGSEGVIRAATEIILHELWVGRERLTFDITHKLLKLDPGDVFIFAPTGRMYRTASIKDMEFRHVEAFQVDPLAYVPTLVNRSFGRRDAPALIVRPLAMFIDGHMITDDDFDHAGYLGGLMSPWKSGMAVYRSATDTNYRLDTSFTAPAVMGLTKEEFFPGPMWRWDDVNELKIEILRGTLSSITDEVLLGGDTANLIAVENVNGEWEYLQFGIATLTAPRKYTLSHLIRGQRGTEAFMGDPIAVGSRVILLDGALRQPGITPGQVGTPFNYRIGPATLDVGNPSYRQDVFTSTGKGRRPYSPQRIRGVHEVDGDWAIDWIRRTRVGGVAWPIEEEPLSEAIEEYQVDILSEEGGDVLRSAVVTSPAYTYSAADQVTDFGSEQANLWVRVRQRSETYGLGIANETLIE